MTERHNTVQDWIKEAVKKNRKLKDEDFRSNQTVVLDKFEKLKNFDVKQFGNIRPDLQYWVKLGDEDKKKDIWKLFMVEFAITFGKRDTDEYHNSLDKMRMHKTDKYSRLVNYVKNELAKRSDFKTEYRIEFRTFIISSLGAVPNETVKSFKSMIGKCSISNACLWLKGAVCKALKGSIAIWTGGRDMLYNMMRPKVDLKKLDEEDESIERGGSVEPEQEKLNRNLRALLREEMESSFVGFGEDSPRYKQSIVNATEFKDLTQVLIDPHMEMKDQVEENSLCTNDQVEEAQDAAESEEERRTRSKMREAGFSGTKCPVRIEVSGSESSSQ
jgi:hypothetical protein